MIGEYLYYLHIQICSLDEMLPPGTSTSSHREAANQWRGQGCNRVKEPLVDFKAKLHPERSNREGGRPYVFLAIHPSRTHIPAHRWHIDRFSVSCSSMGNCGRRKRERDSLLLQIIIFPLSCCWRRLSGRS